MIPKNRNILLSLRLQQHKVLISNNVFLTRRSFHINSVILNNRSPIQIFRDTFKKEWEKSTQLQDQIKTLSAASDKLANSSTFKNAKNAYISASKSSNTILSKTLKKTGENLEDITFKAWDSDIVQNTRKNIQKIDESLDPLRQTKVYKDINETLSDEDAALRYGGFISKDQRRQKRLDDIQSGKHVKPTSINENAGTNIVLSESNSNNKNDNINIGEKLNDFQKSSVGKNLNFVKVKVWDENENPLIVGMRKVTSTVSKFFGETESSRVLTQFKLIDSNFSTNSFLKHLRNYIVPEILEAYIKGDEKVLRQWFSDAPFNVYNAQQKELRKQKIFSDGRILDIRGIDIVSAKLLAPQDIPVLVVGCRAQEINLFKKVTTNEIVAGSESDIRMSSYAMVFTRDPEKLDNEETEGWRILEFVRGGSRQFT